MNLWFVCLFIVSGLGFAFGFVCDSQMQLLLGVLYGQAAFVAGIALALPWNAR